MTSHEADVGATLALEKRHSFVRIRAMVAKLGLFVLVSHL